MAAPLCPVVAVREVWQDNLVEEFYEITRLLPHHRFLAAIDTEFPGHVFPATSGNHHSQLSPAENYLRMKRNVDATNIIQLGLALCDANGGPCFVWEFNFKDFDKDTQLYNSDSIELLESQGFDFQKNREQGIDSLDFARLISKSGLLNNSNLTWVTFHGGYDFGYLVKILIRRELPSDLMQFMGLVAFFFGYRVFDIKHMIRLCDGVYGGLERVAKNLGVERVAGKSHQAGSDSLLTLQTIIKLKKVHFFGRSLTKFQLVLHGLEVDVGQLIASRNRMRQVLPIGFPYALPPGSWSPKYNIPYGFQGRCNGYFFPVRFIA